MSDARDPDLFTVSRREALQAGAGAAVGGLTATGATAAQAAERCVGKLPLG